MNSLICSWVLELFSCSLRSSAGRDQIGPYLLCDTTWLTNDPQNPLAVGQYVNNRTKNKPANVAYQEVDIPLQSVAPKLWKYLPNVWYSSGNIAGENSFLRIIALVSVCKICEGDEVLSSYFTVVNWQGEESPDLLPILPHIMLLPSWEALPPSLVLSPLNALHGNKIGPKILSFP